MKNALQYINKELVTINLVNQNYYIGFIQAIDNFGLLLALINDDGTYAGTAYVPFRNIYLLETKTKILNSIEKLWRKCKFTLPTIQIDNNDVLTSFCNYIMDNLYYVSLGYHNDLESDCYGIINAIIDNKVFMQMYDDEMLTKDGLCQIHKNKIECLFCDMKSGLNSMISNKQNKKDWQNLNVLELAYKNKDLIEVHAEFMDAESFDAGYVIEYSDKDYLVLRINPNGSYDGIAAYSINRTSAIEWDTEYLKKLKSIEEVPYTIPLIMAGEKSCIETLLAIALDNHKIVTLKLGLTQLDDIMGIVESYHKGVLKISKLVDKQPIGYTYVDVCDITEILYDASEEK